MSYTLTIHFSAGDRTYPVQRNGFSIEYSVGAKGKHQTQSASVSIRSREAALTFLTTKDELIKAEVKNGSDVVFEGIVRPYRNFSAYGASENPLDLEILDYTELLHVYSTEKIIYKAQNIESIIRDVFDKVELSTVLQIPGVLSQISIDYCICDVGIYFNEWLAQLLYEYGYDFHFKPGMCEIIPTTAESSDDSIDDIRNVLQVSRSDDRNDGIRVKYGKYPSKKIRLLTHRSKEFKWETSILNPFVYRRKTGYYYNNQMNEESMTSESWVKWNPTEVLASDIVNIDQIFWDWYVDQPNGVISFRKNTLKLYRDNVGLDGACVNMAYDYDFATGLFSGGWQFVIMADARVRYRVENAEESYTSGDSPTVINTQFITTQEMAEELAKRESARLTGASVTYTFQSLTGYEVGQFYSLRDPEVTGVQSLVRVLTCELTSDGLYNITAEGAGDVSTAVDVKTLRLKDLSEAGTDFMALNVDDSELEEGESCTVTVTGSILDYQDEYGFTYKWYVNGDEINGESGLSVVIPAGRLKGGINEVKCSSLYQDKVHASAVARVDNLAVSETEIEYAVGNSPDNPPLGEMLWEGVQMTWEGEPMSWDDGVWSKEAPTPGRGQYLWMRTRRV